MRHRERLSGWRLCGLIILCGIVVSLSAWGDVLPQAQADFPWPTQTRESRPWTYWWWMGSAADRESITTQLETFRQAGLGGVHIIPIYGAKGYEDRYIDYLSPAWMDMLRHTTVEAQRLGMGVDITLGTGWCFGGPTITDALANALVQHRVDRITGPAEVDRPVHPAMQAIAAYGPDGHCIELTGSIQNNRLIWTAPAGEWHIYEVWQRPSGQKVKRAAPGGEGHMLNPFSREAIETYLKRFDAFFDRYDGPPIRAVYQDSYEYQGNWSPDLFEVFGVRRGYRLEHCLPALLGQSDDTEQVSRVKADYRRTLSEMLTEHFTQTWVDWARTRQAMTRNQAHGSPGNLLDVYGQSDIPETEFFRFDRNPLVSKFASSAAHTMGRKFVSSETGTWLQEHFQVTLGHLKPFIDGLFVSGVNHVFYHGTCYSPNDAAWPGWVFYASTQMNPRNSIWTDVPSLNAYIARSQSVLQSGRSDNDLLLYWPIDDYWSDAKGMQQTLTVHQTGWLTGQPIGTWALALWNLGYAFDYCSDRQLTQASMTASGVALGGGSYRAVVVPAAVRMRLETFEALHRLAHAGATVIFLEQLPSDVPGWGDLKRRRDQLKAMLDALVWHPADGVGRRAAIGKGQFLVGDTAETLLDQAGVPRERMADRPGIRFVRRADETGHWYFITNQDRQFIHAPDTPRLDDWLTLSVDAASVIMMDPMTGKTGKAKSRFGPDGQTEVYVQLDPGQSVILRALKTGVTTAAWRYYQPGGEAVTLKGTWAVEFTDGGPTLPAPFTTDQPGSWTVLGDADAGRFAGTARYTLVFDMPETTADAWTLDLGSVADSAVVRVNGERIGAVFSHPFTLELPSSHLKAIGNRLEIDVTNVSANRIRSLDRDGVLWKNFYDINFVNIDYKAFNAADWPLRDSGLLGAVRLIPLKAME